MDALPFQAIELVAIDPARNIRRRWRVAAYRDLFGHVIIETGWGRIGSRGRVLIASFPGETEAVRHIAGLLRRRVSAPRRIGTCYARADADMSASEWPAQTSPGGSNREMRVPRLGV